MLRGVLARTVRLYIASLHNQLMYPKMCSIDIFVDIQPVGWLKFERETFFRPLPGLQVRVGQWGSRMGPIDSSLMGSYEFSVDKYDLLPLLSY